MDPATFALTMAITLCNVCNSLAITTHLLKARHLHYQIRPLPGFNIDIDRRPAIVVIEDNILAVLIMHITELLCQLVVTWLYGTGGRREFPREEIEMLFM